MPQGSQVEASSAAASPAPSWSRGVRRIGLTTLPWLVLALLYTPGSLYADRTARVPSGWTHILPCYLVMYLIWALYTPVIAAVWRRYELRWPPRWRAVAVHLTCATVLVALNALLMAVFDVVISPEPGAGSLGNAAVQNLVYRTAPGFVQYTATVACLAAWDALRRYHQRERGIVQAQLDALQRQLEPHFLFNTLNAVSELVYRDPGAADRVLTQLSGLLRQLLGHRAHEHSLHDELVLLRAYVSIQRTLLGDRLRMQWDLADDLLRSRVPTLLLQPMVENAICHGVAQLRSGGTVTVQARRHGSRLQLWVRNDGPPPTKTSRDGGLGLANTRARLQALYGNEHQLELRALAGGGSELAIELPWREAPAGDARAIVRAGPAPEPAHP
jgi:two-component system, LytTR family, sensor kinase